ncbi:hypothetical protein YC2023_044756 [Brassica napus]
MNCEWITWSSDFLERVLAQFIRCHHSEEFQIRLRVREVICCFKQYLITTYFAHSHTCGLEVKLREKSFQITCLTLKLLTVIPVFPSILLCQLHLSTYFRASPKRLSIIEFCKFYI